MEGMEKELVEVAFLRAITRYLDWIGFDGSDGIKSISAVGYSR